MLHPLGLSREKALIKKLPHAFSTKALIKKLPHAFSTNLKFRMVSLVYTIMRRLELM